MTMPGGGSLPAYLIPNSNTGNFTAIQPPPSACIYAEMRYGSNGSDGGAPELLIGNNGSDATAGRITWDESTGAFNSGRVAFGFTIPPGGGSANQDSLAVNGAVTDPLYYSLKTYGAMRAVLVIAGVQTNASAAFTNLVVQYYKGGTLIEAFDLAAGPSVDTTSASSPVAEQVLTVTPNNSDNDEVFVGGSFQMTAPNGTFPDVDDIFGQIFVQTATCSS